MQGDAGALHRALESTDAHRLYGHAVRHKCAALLFEAIAAQRERGANARMLLPMLKQYAARFALDASHSLEQICGVVDALNSASVPFALLKSAGRIYAGDRLTQRTQSFDLDIMVPRRSAAACVAALKQHGYAYEDACVARGYQTYHHHLAPLIHPEFRKSLEVHVLLARPQTYSLPSDWETLACDFERIGGPAGAALRFNALGRAWHMALHGASLYRLGDVAQIALETMREDATIVQTLFQRSTREAVSRVPLQAVLLLAARLAGVPVSCDTRTQRYIDWAIQREDLPRFFRERARLIDAWHADGALLGPATRLALPKAHRYDGATVPLPQRARAVAGLAIGAAGVALGRPLLNSRR
ncbi:MAG TPA: nucleotidyltransferase family protein [Candidatus Baltobacteraceae bacterium]